ncbi:benzoate 1,2-dioxygenase electron transfer component BenC [Corynebacterium guangdongense]|uniref:Benzoate/toluate 1,2-dioxygenase reductase subunit n=1 Tax=Corynebacterium guangdongense TaxID=1783348 RepID=A0ABU1ZYT6_9CORY|nr:benzoate 1,2-dioxygenase electron transfer component BenC [Corynebacterium guangdongense]MDR7330090.1 benzoate/toluate 1,2-dioxygenase reductase subunit [Corynebacterium guangdongense]WJZ18648.1 Benzoate 1,2-dioxygenase electron transfer component [Corynebacterium guangdongense]
MTTAAETQRVALSFEDGITRFIEVEEDQTIVDAAYKARINIPFDCRDGACGTCKAFCESGEYEEGDYIDEALTDAEADEGYILCCQTYPLSEMLVNVPITSAAAKTGAATLIGTITELEQLSPSTIRFAVEIKDRESLTYLPGQYMNIAPPNADFHRSYSFSSGPSDDIVTFLVKYTPGGLMTTYLTEQAKVGDELNLTGPMGSFFLREPNSPLLLLAGGTGLAPILAILERLAELEDYDKPVRLVFGATKNHDIVEVERLNSYKDKLKDFDWFTVVSDPAEEHERKGYVTDHLDPDEHLHNGDADVYLCGPPPMVEAVRTYLGALDNPPTNFYYEKFTPQGTGDGGTEKVTVTRESDETSRTLTVESSQVESGQVHSRVADSEAQFQALNALEVGVASLVIDLLDEEDFEEMTRLAEEANRHIDGSVIADADGFITANTAFHEFLFRRSGNEAMLQAYRSLRTEEVMVRDLQDGSQIEPEIPSDHLKFIEALRSRDMAAVREVVGHHTEIAVSTMSTAIRAQSGE